MSFQPPQPPNGWPTSTVPSPGVPPPAVPYFYPFGAIPALSSPPINYDIVIDKDYPRVGFMPTEQGGIYQEIVEVNGDLWMVANATWDNSLQGFYQLNTPIANCNASTNAFAWCMRGTTGDAIRFFGAATNNPQNPVVWTATFDTAPMNTTVSPLPISAPNAPAFAVNASFNSAITTRLTAFQINVTNIAASSSSALEQFNVNNVPVWMVDATGTLQIGSVSSLQLKPPVYGTLTAGTGVATIGPPPSATIGLAHGDYVDLANKQTITGIKTVYSGNPQGSPPTPMIFGGGDGSMVGGPDDGIFMCSGGDIQTFGPIGGSLAQSMTFIARSPTVVIVGLKQTATGANANYPFANQPAQSLTLYCNTGCTVGSTYVPTIIGMFDLSGNLTIAGGLNAFMNSTFTGPVIINGALTVTGTVNFQGHFYLSAQGVQDLQTYFETFTNNQMGGPYNPPYLGSGLEISYDSGTQRIMLNTGRLALIGVDNTTGLISSDKTVKITKNSWGNPPAPGDENQIVDFSVKTALGNVLPVYSGGVGSPQIANPQICYGVLTVNLDNLGGGPGGGASCSTPLPTVQFPVSFNDTSFTLTFGTHLGWYIVNETARTAAGFTFNVGAFATPPVQTSATVWWTAIGPAIPGPP